MLYISCTFLLLNVAVYKLSSFTMEGFILDILGSKYFVITLNMI